MLTSEEARPEGRVRDQHSLNLVASTPFSCATGTKPLDCVMAREPGSVELPTCSDRRRTPRSAWRPGFQPSVRMGPAPWDMFTVPGCATLRFEPLFLSPELVGIGLQRARNFSTSSSDKRVPM